MTLSEHLRELRSRVFKSVLAVLVFGIVGFILRDQIVSFLTDPFQNAAMESDAQASMNFRNMTDPLVVPLQIAMLTGLVFGAPVWIYQAWGFITPALYHNEKRWTAVVIGTAVPMFGLGVLLAMWVMPRAMEFLLDFTPTEDVSNIVDFSSYLSFVIRVVLVFGIGFLLPIFVVMLNVVGVLQHEALSAARRWVIVGIFAFGAIATPTGDPLSLMVLATPMWLLFEVAVLVCRVLDHRRRRRFGGELSDDEATPDDELNRLGRVDDDG
ncbi:sec-independent protein translocase protein TatC [Haloactinopolyspora alba]|uniref:Sec-independent protein translocase protein TatC n=1 Tax=Haloactinopolyspora alba TaxID=648780 RepID=A0A2P8DYC4_9ACTN|nr:twin-arginine translocase subunit TatC [Haloactinopolyspora alba]PSL02211.1 sec-independent protein translocase protein TatC [Haloactinopolyspora alba]